MEEEQERLGQMRQILEPLASKLVDILVRSTDQGQQRQFAVIEIGIKAWQLGRMEGMKLLHEMAMEQYREKCRESSGLIDLISQWWDGIGSWKNEPLFVKGRMV